MKNMMDLTMQASQVAEDLITGKIDVRTATEFNNTCGKVINAQKLMLAAVIVRQQVPEMSLPYLDDCEVGELARPMPKMLRQG